MTNRRDVDGLPPASFYEDLASNPDFKPNIAKPREITRIVFETDKIAKAIVIAGLIIGATHLYSGRYVATGFGDKPGSIVVDTWFWRTSICHGTGCNSWQSR